MFLQRTLLLVFNFFLVALGYSLTFDTHCYSSAENAIFDFFLVALCYSLTFDTLVGSGVVYCKSYTSTGVLSREACHSQGYKARKPVT